MSLPRRRTTRPRRAALYVYDLPVRSGVAYCYSLVPPERLLGAGGLPRPAILGVSDQPEPREYERFRPNLLFVDLLNAVIARHAHEDPAVAEQAAQLQEGRLPLWDLRHPRPGPRRAPEELLGWLEVRGGQVLPGVWHPNPEHTLISRHGLFVLPPGVERRLMEELLALRVPLAAVAGEH